MKKTKNQSPLGRGLNSLIPSRGSQGVRMKLERDERLDREKVYQIPLDKIKENPLQPRQNFSHASLEELINSIKEHGIIQPLIVSRQGDEYQLIAGERRVRAARVLGLKKAPAIIREVKEQEKLELALIENIQRKDLNPLERALGYQKLMDEFNLTQKEVAKKVGKSREVVANTLRFLTLPAAIQKALADDKITEGHAKVILGLKSEEEKIKFYERILKDGLTVRATEAKTRRKKSKKREIEDPNVVEKEEELREALATKVKIEKQGRRGKIIIEFYSPQELLEIIKKISS